jgi:hypothetical protein
MKKIKLIPAFLLLSFIFICFFASESSALGQNSYNHNKKRMHECTKPGKFSVRSHKIARMFFHEKNSNINYCIRNRNTMVLPSRNRK